MQSSQVEIRNVHIIRKDGHDARPVDFDPPAAHAVVSLACGTEPLELQRRATREGFAVSSAKALPCWDRNLSPAPGVKSQ